MKRCFILIITLVLLSSLVGCGKDPLAKRVIEQIDSIGEVSLEDQELIEESEYMYSKMTEKQKNQVDNYIVLLDARKVLDELLLQKLYESEKKLEEMLENYSDEASDDEIIFSVD